MLPSQACLPEGTLAGMAATEDPVTSIILERAAMILGMNPGTLRKSRPWSAYLWPRRHHWALVLQPDGKAFDARITDDFVHNAQHCYSAEVPSSRLFLVYEMLVEKGEPFVMLSVKPDFDPYSTSVYRLGVVGPMAFEDLQRCALGVVRRYRSYCIVGCNCQHFATDLARSLGVSPAFLPQDDASAVAHAAAEGASALGAAGAVVAATSAIGAVCASSASGAATATMFVPVVLSTVALTASAVGVVGGFLLIGLSGGYRVWYNSLRDDADLECFGVESKAWSTYETPEDAEGSSEKPRPISGCKDDDQGSHACLAELTVVEEKSTELHPADMAGGPEC